MTDYKQYILSQLKQKQFARFSDIKPAKVSTNTFSYHVKKLIKNGWIIKSDQGYTLGMRGLAYVDRDTAGKEVRSQPNVNVVLLIQDGYGKVLLKRRDEQPYINGLELPTVRASVADTSILGAGEWACRNLLKIDPGVDMRHVGDCYVRVHKGKLALGSSINHVLRFELDNITIADEYLWVKPLNLSQNILVPGTENIITRAFFNDSFFFEEYTVQLNDQALLKID